ncbi:MAG TPA: transposase [Acidobacteriota bacterium]|jgi:hypothetical protein
MTPLRQRMIEDMQCIDNDQVTFRYRDNRCQQMRSVKLPAVEFIGRFLQHVLPRGCAKVRYYGICSPSCRKQLDQARTLLTVPIDHSQSTPIAPSPEPPGTAPPLSPLPHRTVHHHRDDPSATYLPSMTSPLNPCALSCWVCHPGPPCE